MGCREKPGRSAALLSTMPEYQKFLKAQTGGWHIPFDPVSNPDHMAFLKRYDLGV